MIFSAVACLLICSNCLLKSRSSKLNTSSALSYAAKCMRAMDLESLPTVSCNDFPETVKIFYNQNGLKVVNPYRPEGDPIGPGKCLNPDFAGNLEDCHTTTGGTHGGYYKLKKKSSDGIVYLAISCSNTKIQPTRVSAHLTANLRDPLTGQTCWFGDETDFDGELDLKFADDSELPTCLPCHTPYVYTRTASLLSHQIEKRLELTFKDQIQTIKNEMLEKHQTGSRTVTLTSKNLKVELDIHPPLNSIKGNIVGMEMGAPNNIAFKEQEVSKDQLYGFTSTTRQELRFDEMHRMRKVVKNRPSLQPCFSCHLIGASFYYARNAATLFHVCELPSNSQRVCRGFDDVGFLKTSGDILHNVLFNTKIKVTTKLKDAIKSYADDCIGRHNSDRCEYDLIPFQEFPMVDANKQGRRTPDILSQRALSDEVFLDANFHSSRR
jgi:hypothetical protein